MSLLFFYIFSPFKNGFIIVSVHACIAVSQISELVCEDMAELQTYPCSSGYLYSFPVKGGLISQKSAETKRYEIVLVLFGEIPLTYTD